ncbi:hypothetical protein VP01_1946g7 [Puccinia sorghi]|uniref:Splicing factor cactin central domain-containing protein n=1 Tax=Puccinia sorghi TaxID=27349 RepID=A0A0L6VCA3_9BASI|nr:hypothetical protein VP01_1946g7 [Puccinia sorghi]
MDATIKTCDLNLSPQFDQLTNCEKERKMGLAEAEELKRLTHCRAEKEKELELREAESNWMAKMAKSAHMAKWISKEEKRAKSIDLLSLNIKWDHWDFEAEEDLKKNHLQRLINRTTEEEDYRNYRKKNLKKNKEIFLYWDLNKDFGAGMEMHLNKPYTIFDDLTLEETQFLAEDRKLHISLEKYDSNLEFW